MSSPSKPPSSPLNLYFKCTRSLVQKQTFPHLTADRPQEASQTCLSEEGLGHRFKPSRTPPSMAPSLLGAEGPWALLSSVFFIADPRGPALGPSRRGNSGSGSPSPGPKDVPGVSEALSEVGHVAGGAGETARSLAHGRSCRLVFPQGPGQAAPTRQQDSQRGQDPARPAPGIPASAAPQPAWQVLPGGHDLPDQLRPEPHSGLGQAEEEAVTRQGPGQPGAPAPEAAHVTCRLGGGPQGRQLAAHQA